MFHPKAMLLPASGVHREWVLPAPKDAACVGRFKVPESSILRSSQYAPSMLWRCSPVQAVFAAGDKKGHFVTKTAMKGHNRT
jgi:hypothetical protein